MPQTLHLEKHFTASAQVRDVVIGMSDGLTVPFALAAGLSGAVSSSSIVITAGLAEIVAGSIAMGLGGFLAARCDAEHYAAERVREESHVRFDPEQEASALVEALEIYGLTHEQSTHLVAALRERPEAWVNVMMRMELGLEEPNPRRAFASALTIGGAYIAGGLIPLIPYFFFQAASMGLLYSIGATAVALLLFGYVKGLFTGTTPVRSALQTVMIGGLAAAAAFGVAKAIQH